MKSRFCKFAAVGLIAFGSFGCASQAALNLNKFVDAPVQSQTRQPGAIAQTVAKLREIKTKSDSIEEAATKIPPDAKTLLPTLKHQLRDLIQETLSSQNNVQIDSQNLQAQILDKLKNDGIEVKEPEQTVVDENYVEPEFFQGFGEIYEIEMRQPAEHNDLIAVTTELSIPYGVDTSLYIFKNKGERWELILAKESNGYDEITGAQSQFGYSISPSDRQNKFFVVTANINPWIASCWQSIRYAVLREGQTADKPQTVLNKNHTIYRCHEPPFFIETTANSFTISFDGGETMDKLNEGEEVSDEEINRTHVEKYKVSGTRVKLISLIGKE